MNRARWLSRQLDIARLNCLATLDEVDKRRPHSLVRILVKRIQRRWPWLDEAEGLAKLRQRP